MGTVRSEVLSPRPEPLPLSHVTWVLSVYSTFSHLSLFLPPYLLSPLPASFFQLCSAGPVSELPLHSILLLMSFLSLTVPTPFPSTSLSKEQFLGGLIS